MTNGKSDDPTLGGIVSNAKAVSAPFDEDRVSIPPHRPGIVSNAEQAVPKTGEKDGSKGGIVSNLNNET